ARAACVSAAADLALLRVGEGDELETVAVAGPAALVAELHGERVRRTELPDARVAVLDEAPSFVRRVVERAGADAFIVLPVRANGTSAVLELYRGGVFSPSEELVAELAAGQAALVLRAFSAAPDTNGAAARRALELAGDALAAAGRSTEPAAELVHL